MACENTESAVGLKPGLSIALVARAAWEQSVALPALKTFFRCCRSFQAARTRRDRLPLKWGEAMSDVTGDEAGKEKVKLCHE